MENPIDLNDQKENRANAKKQPQKTKISFYLEPRNEFVCDVGKHTKLINALLDDMFGNNSSSDPEQEALLRIEKMLKAQKYISQK